MAGTDVRGLSLRLCWLTRYVLLMNMRAVLITWPAQKIPTGKSFHRIHRQVVVTMPIICVKIYAHRLERGILVGLNHPSHSSILLRKEPFGHANVKVEQAMVAINTKTVMPGKRSTTDSVLPYPSTTQSKARSLALFMPPVRLLRLQQMRARRGGCEQNRRGSANGNGKGYGKFPKRAASNPAHEQERINPATSEMLIVTTVKLISCAPRSAAWKGDIPCSRI